MERIKIDRVRKQITLKDRANMFTGLPQVKKAKMLGDINYPKFDKHISEYVNIKGLTYVFKSNIEDEDDTVDVEIKSSVQIDEDLKKRYFAGLSEDAKIAIQEVKDEYNL